MFYNKYSVHNKYSDIRIDSFINMLLAYITGIIIKKTEKGLPMYSIRNIKRNLANVMVQDALRKWNSMAVIFGFQ